MNNLLNKKYLEKKFSDDFSSPLFPVLANFYYKNNDLVRAKKVCEIGLQYSPENYNGKFIFAKILISSESFIQAEKLLKEIMKNDPINIASLRLLIEISIKINRSHNTIIKYIKILLTLIPNDIKYKNWLQTNNYHDTENSDFIPKSAQSKSKQEGILISQASNTESSIKSNMITFTMVNILINQKHYKKALYVLDELQLIGADTKKITDIKNKIKKLIIEEEKIL